VNRKVSVVASMIHQVLMLFEDLLDLLYVPGGGQGFGQFLFLLALLIFKKVGFYDIPTEQMAWTG